MSELNKELKILTPGALYKVNSLTELTRVKDAKKEESIAADKLGMPVSIGLENSYLLYLYTKLHHVTNHPSDWGPDLTGVTTLLAYRHYCLMSDKLVFVEWALNGADFDFNLKKYLRYRVDDTGLSGFPKEKWFGLVG